MYFPRNGICAPLARPFEAGFTVIEVAITLVIAAVGLALAVPSLQQVVANNQVTVGNNSIVSGLNLARSSAITTGGNITICPTATGDSCSQDNWENGWIVFNDGDGDSIADAGEIVRAVTLDGKLEASGFANLIVFQSDGTTSLGSDVTITNCHTDSSVSSHCLDVNVSAFGMIQSGPHASESPIDGGSS